MTQIPTLIAGAIAMLMLAGCGAPRHAPPAALADQLDGGAREQPDDAQPMYDTTGAEARAWTWADSPVSPTVEIINSNAIEPGKLWGGDWVEKYGSSFLIGGQTPRYIPYVQFRYTVNLTDEQKREIQAAVRRAFKVWTRHLEIDIRPGQPDTWGNYNVWIGGRCGSADAIACASGASATRSGTIHIPRASAMALSGGVSIAMFGTLAHEVGHALGYDDDIREAGLQPHADSGTRQLMAPFQHDSVTVVPQPADVAGLRRAFLYADEAAGHDSFGWWGVHDPALSGLYLFGVSVSRTLSVANPGGELLPIAMLDGASADVFTSDTVKIGAFVDGIATPRRLLRGKLGGATWNGILLGVDHFIDSGLGEGYGPVRGQARLRMNLDERQLSAGFRDLEAWTGAKWAPRTWAARNLSYTLHPVDGRDGHLWADSGRHVDAAFFATKTHEDTPWGQADYAGRVAGHLHDEDVGLTGAYSAVRN